MTGQRAVVSVTVGMSDQTLRRDAGKAPWHLLPLDAVGQVVDVLAFGASKYRERGWEKGMAWSRCVASMQRHLVAWWQNGEDIDPESGLPHVAHIACNALFLAAYRLRKIGVDDRPRAGESVVRAAVRNVFFGAEPAPTATQRINPPTATQRRIDFDDIKIGDVVTEDFGGGDTLTFRVTARRRNACDGEQVKATGKYGGLTYRSICRDQPKRVALYREITEEAPEPIDFDDIRQGDVVTEVFNSGNVTSEALDNAMPTSDLARALPVSATGAFVGNTDQYIARREPGRIALYRSTKGVTQ